MVALTAPRKVDRYGDKNPPDLYFAPVAANVKLWAGAIVCLNASGQAVPATTALGLRPAGIVEKTYDNTGGAAGAFKVDIRAGVFPVNILAADPVTQADAGVSVYLADDNTVARTAASNTRSVAGTMVGMTDDGTQALVRISLV